MTGEPSLQAQLEAVLMVVDEPVTAVELAYAVERPPDEVTGLLGQMAAAYDQQGRGFELRQVAGGWRFYSHPDCAAVVERFVQGGQQARLTQAALETLAIVAYQQPVTRAKASAIRGVSCDAVLRTLVNRGLVEEVGVEHESGAILFGTTSVFLEKIGLNSVDELPPLAPFLPPADEIEDSGART